MISQTLQRAQGMLYAVLSSSTFGLAPLFTLLLLDAGYSPFEALSYRWSVAAFFLGICAVASGRSFRLGWLQWRSLLLLSAFRAATSLCLVLAYMHIASGVASTIHFMYPLAVALAMICLFGEKKSVWTLGAIGISIFGAMLLSTGSAGFARGDSVHGIGAACLSVVTYGGYVIGLRRSRAVEIDAVVLTCCVTAFGALLFFLGGMMTGGVRFETDGMLWLCILGLALPATAVSNMTLVLAVKRIGPTLTSLFGALEPLTAVIIGVVCFNEPLTLRGMAGMLLIIVAVSMVIFRNRREMEPVS